MNQELNQVEQGEEEEYDSNIYDNMNEDDLIQVNEENENDDQNQEEFLDVNIKRISNNLNKTKKRKLICIGLQSAEISKYIKQTPAQFGSSRRIEIVACEIFSNLF